MVQQNKSVLIIGAAVIDIIVEVERLPVTGEDIYGEHKETIVGGCAYNVQQVIEKFKIDHQLFTPIGHGPYASIIRKDFLKKNIPIVLEDDAMDNGWNISFIENDGERTFLSVPGLEIHWQSEWFERINLANYDYIYLSGYELEGDSGKIISEQVIKNKAPEAKIVFDPGPRISYIEERILDKILKAGTIVHCNETELKELVPGDSIEASVTQLHKHTGEPVVITMGKEGCFYMDAYESGIIPAEQVEVVDTIGAGDSHTGAFISGLAKGFSVKEACELGNKISALIVQQTGGTLSDEMMKNINAI